MALASTVSTGTQQQHKGKVSRITRKIGRDNNHKKESNKIPTAAIVKDNTNKFYLPDKSMLDR